MTNPPKAPKENASFGGLFIFKVVYARDFRVECNVYYPESFNYKHQ